MAAQEKKGAKKRKDQEMAARLKAEGVRRTSGVCCICYRTIGNDGAAENHYGAHARGVDNR